MNNIATSINDKTDTRLSVKTNIAIVEKEMNEYNRIKSQVESLGGAFLNDEQASQYVYGNDLPKPIHSCVTDPIC